MTALASQSTPKRTGLRVALWIVQILLAAAFGMAGVIKGFMPMPELGDKIFWARDVPLALTRFIGASELLGAIGLILPSLTRIQPRLTTWAAGALTTVMVLAIGFHTVRGETQYVVSPLVLGVLAAFVTLGRARLAPIARR